MNPTHTPKPTLAVALIVKDEADNLAACLETVRDWVDEIVILDSGSVDATEAVARRYTEQFFVNADWPGFGAQRRLAQNYVRSDFILWLDADERVTPTLQRSILAAVEADEAHTVYSLCRLSWAFGRYIRHCGWYPGRVVRLYPRRLTQYDQALVHEKVVVGGEMRVKLLHGDVIHYTYRDLHHYLVKSAGYSRDWAVQRQDSGKKGGIAQGLLHAAFCFMKMYLFRLGFLDGRQGLLLSLVSAHATFTKYADLWLLTSAQKPKD